MKYLNIWYFKKTHMAMTGKTHIWLKRDLKSFVTRHMQIKSSEISVYMYEVTVIKISKGACIVRLQEIGTFILC